MILFNIYVVITSEYNILETEFIKDETFQNVAYWNTSVKKWKLFIQINI